MSRLYIYIYIILGESILLSIGEKIWLRALYRSNHWIIPSFLICQDTKISRSSEVCKYITHVSNTTKIKIKLTELSIHPVHILTNMNDEFTHIKWSWHFKTLIYIGRWQNPKLRCTYLITWRDEPYFVTFSHKNAFSPDISPYLNNMHIQNMKLSC